MTLLLVDGTDDCFYTAVFDGFKKKDLIITSHGDVQLGLGYEFEEVTTNEEKAARVRRKLHALDIGAENDIKLILKSGDATKENVALEYIRLIIKHGGAVRGIRPPAPP